MSSSSSSSSSDAAAAAGFFGAASRRCSAAPWTRARTASSSSTSAALERSRRVLRSVSSTSSWNADPSAFWTKVSSASAILSSRRMFSLASLRSNWPWTRSSMRTESSSPSSTGAAAACQAFLALSGAAFCREKWRIVAALATRPTKRPPNFALLIVAKPVWSTLKRTSTWSGRAMGQSMSLVRGGRALPDISLINVSTLSASTSATAAAESRSSS
mmetsp:Transcript_12077/g.37190  ORF Transcript_12077/g.37190 Transcript_12077/m.37190 type:complete len:216 (-) Transcript_12077:599-1246(-)